MNRQAEPPDKVAKHHPVTAVLAVKNLVFSPWPRYSARLRRSDKNAITVALDDTCLFVELTLISYAANLTYGRTLQGLAIYDHLANALIVREFRTALLNALDDRLLHLFP